MPVRNFAWFGDNILFETDENGDKIVDYTWAGDELISERRNGKTYTHYYDGQGNTIALTDEDGNVTDTFDYDAWGNVIERTGDTPTPFQWHGQVGYYWDDALGRYHVRARPYEPASGRWTTQDPLLFVDGMNLYQYVDNNPINFVDPSGMDFGAIDASEPLPPPAPFPASGGEKVIGKNSANHFSFLCRCPTRKRDFIKKYGKITGSQSYVKLTNQTIGESHIFNPVPGKGEFFGSGGHTTSVSTVIYCPGKGVASFHFGTTQDANATIRNYWWPADCVAVICGGNDADKASNCLMQSVVVGLRGSKIKIEGIMDTDGCYRGPDGWYIGLNTQASTNNPKESGSFDDYPSD